MTATAGPGPGPAANPRDRDRAAQERRAVHARIAQRHEGPLRRFLRVLGAGAEIDDLVQQTFLVLLQRDFEERDDRATGAFLRRTARNLFLRRHRDLLPQIEAAEAVWQRACGDDDGDGYVAALRACLDGLGTRARRIVEACYGEDLGRDAIARELGMTPDGVKTALRRIRARLEECIERRRER